MGTDLEKFDPRVFEERIKDRIKDEFVSMLPDEMFTEMVRDVLEKFTKPYKHGWNDQDTSPSHFEQTALSVFKEWVGEQVKAVLESPEWKAEWKDGRDMVSDTLRELLTENAGAIVANVLGDAMQNTLTSMQSRL